MPFRYGSDAFPITLLYVSFSIITTMTCGLTTRVGAEVAARACVTGVLRRATGRAVVGGGLGGAEVADGGGGNVVVGETTGGDDDVDDTGAGSKTCEGAGVALLLAGDVGKSIAPSPTVTIRKKRPKPERRVN